MPPITSVGSRHLVMRRAGIDRRKGLGLVVAGVARAPEQPLLGWIELKTALDARHVQTREVGLKPEVTRALRASFEPESHSLPFIPSRLLPACVVALHAPPHDARLAIAPHHRAGVVRACSEVNLWAPQR